MLFALLSYLAKDTTLPPIHKFKVRGSSSSPIGTAYSSLNSIRLKEVHSIYRNEVDRKETLSMDLDLSDSFKFTSRVRESVNPENIEAFDNKEARLPYYSFKPGFDRLRHSGPKSAYRLNTSQNKPQFLSSPLPFSESIELSTSPIPIRPIPVRFNNVPKEKSSGRSKKNKRAQVPSIQKIDVSTQSRWKYGTPCIASAAQPLQAIRTPVLIAPQKALLTPCIVPASPIARVASTLKKNGSINKVIPAQKPCLTSIKPIPISVTRSRKVPQLPLKALPVKKVALVSANSQTIPARGTKKTPKLVNPKPVEKPKDTVSSSGKAARIPVESKSETPNHGDSQIEVPDPPEITSFVPVRSKNQIYIEEEEKTESCNPLLWADVTLLSCIDAFISNFLFPHIEEFLKQLQKERWALTKKMNSLSAKLSHDLESLEEQLRDYKKSKIRLKRQICRKEHVMSEIHQWLRDNTFRQEDLLHSITGLLEETKREFETKENTFKEQVKELEELHERELSEFSELMNQAVKLDILKEKAKLKLDEAEQFLLATRMKAAEIQSEYEFYEQNIVTEIRDKIVFWISQINNFKPQSFTNPDLVVQSPSSLLERFCDQLKELKFKLPPDKLKKLSSSESEELYRYVQTYFRKRLKSEGGHAILQDLFKRLRIEDSSQTTFTVSYLFETWISEFKEVRSTLSLQEENCIVLKKEYEIHARASAEKHKYAECQKEEVCKVEQALEVKISEIPDFKNPKKDVSDLEDKCKKSNRESLVSSQEIRRVPTLPTSPTKVKLNVRADEHSELQIEALNQKEKLSLAETQKQQLEKTAQKIKESIQNKKQEIKHTRELYEENLSDLENQTEKVMELSKDFKAYRSKLDELPPSILSLFDQSKKPMSYEDGQAFDQKVKELENDFSSDGEFSDFSICYTKWKENFFTPETSIKKAKVRSPNTHRTTRSHTDDPLLNLP